MATTDSSAAGNAALSSSMDTASQRKIKIESNDGESYEIDDKIIDQSLMLKSLAESMHVFLSEINFFKSCRSLPPVAALDVAGIAIPMKTVSKAILGPVCILGSKHVVFVESTVYS